MTGSGNDSRNDSRNNSLGERQRERGHRAPILMSHLCLNPYRRDGRPSCVRRPTFDR